MVKWYFLQGLTVVTFLSSGFKPLKVESNEWFLIKTQTESILVPVSKKKKIYWFEYSFTGNLLSVLSRHLVSRIEKVQKN
jgi:hypothetical protein